MTGSRAREPLAFIYCRISEDRAGGGLGVQRQREDCEAEAERLGFTVLEVFTDNDISAFKGKRRPGYEAMLDRLSEVGHVIVWHTDRLHRRPKELEEYLEACEEHEVLTHSVRGGVLDLSTPDGRLHARLAAMLASHESEHKGQRISRKALETIRQGRHTGGARPFGWDLIPRSDEEKAQKLGARLKINEREAEAIREAAQDYLNGDSLGAICRRWNDPQRPGGPLRTTLGNEWQIQSLRQVLRRDRNVGIATHRGEMVNPEAYPPILDVPTWLSVKRALDERNPPTSHNNKARHLMAGIALCQCGAPARSAWAWGRERQDGSRDRSAVYRCRERGSGHVGKRAAYVDDAVRLALLDWFHHPVRFKRDISPEDKERAERLEAELKRIPEQRLDVQRAFQRGDFDASTAARYERGLNDREREIEVELESLRTTVQRESPDAFRVQQATAQYKDWLGWHIDDQRALIRRTFRVTLLPHFEGSPRVFDPHTVVIEILDGEASLDGDGDPVFYTTGERVGPYWHGTTVAERAERFRQRVKVLRRLEAEARGETYVDPDPAPASPRPVPRWRQSKESAP